MGKHQDSAAGEAPLVVDPVLISRFRRMQIGVWLFLPVPLYSMVAHNLLPDLFTLPRHQTILAVYFPVAAFIIWRYFRCPACKEYLHFFPVWAKQCPKCAAWLRVDRSRNLPEQTSNQENEN